MFFTCLFEDSWNLPKKAVLSKNVIDVLRERNQWKFSHFLLKKSSSDKFTYNVSYMLASLFLTTKIKSIIYLSVYLHFKVKDMKKKSLTLA